jgi:hypothetical protein
MAKDVITRFKLETTQYDSKLKTAARELANFGKTAKASGNDFNDFTRKQVEAARGLGSMATSATNAKQKAKELVGAFNDLARSYNQLTDAQKQSDFGKAMSHSLTELQRRIRETKQEMQGMSGGGGMGGLFGGKGGNLGGMLQVFGGNLMTKAAAMAASFAAEMGEVVQQGVELARQGEGIRIAFERLGRGDILDGLREATHGTVTDLELMKAAVKFNDFNLPLEELGTMLAFAQQKAKDTGQSVDYMVDSIVTGLGRKSLMILDNLGLSATQIKDKMAETGDMTKAVGEIIREQMANAGDYIETAADRAAQADVDLKNAMEELGRTLLPLEEQGVSMWTSLKTGAIELLNDGLKPLVPAVIDLKGEMSDLFDTVSDSSVFSGLVDWLKASWEWCTNLIPVVRSLRSAMADGGMRGIEMNFDQEKAGKANLERLMAEEIAKRNRRPVVVGGGGRTSRGGGRSSVTTPKVEEILPVGSVAALNKELSELRKKQDLATDTAGWLAQQREIDKLTTKIKILKGQMPDPSNIQSAANGASFASNSTFTVPTELNLDTGYIDNILKKEEQMKMAAQMAAQAVSNIGDAFASIEDPSAKAAGTVMQAIASIALGFGQAVAQASSMGPWGWLAYVAAGTAALATTISTVHSLTGFENGGEIKGNSYSGDNTPIMANAGEVVLTRAMAGNIASQLQGSGSNVHVTGELRGESIYLAVNRSLKRRGKGELVTWK